MDINCILEEILTDYSEDKMYKCSPINSCTQFTQLMVIVMNTHKYPILNTIIPNYKDIMNVQNELGWTALMLSLRNIGEYSSIETANILIDMGANTNLCSNKGWNALYIVSRYFITHGYEFELLKLLIHKSSNIHACVKNNNISNAFYLYLNNNAFDAIMVTLFLSYYDIISLQNVKSFSRFDVSTYNKEIISVLNVRIKEEKIKYLQYNNVLKQIPEHDAAVRYKIGNMGYKITKYDFDGVVTDELLNYFDTTPEKLPQKAKEYLYGN